MSSVVKNIVRVHGAFADGSSWSKVIPLLQKLGYKAVAVQNPMTSMADKGAFTKRIIALQDGPVILVGHSWGGAVITQAGDDSKVAALVYVTAYAPEVGQSANDASGPFGWTEGQKDRSRFVWTEKSSQQSLPKACWNTLQKDSPLKSGNLRLRCRASRCSTKSYGCRLEVQAHMDCHFHEGSNAPSGHGRIGREENGRDNDESLNLPHVHPRRASKGHSGDRRRCEERIKQPISVVSSSTGPTTQLLRSE